MFYPGGSISYNLNIVGHGTALGMVRSAIGKPHLLRQKCENPRNYRGRSRLVYSVGEDCYLQMYKIRVYFKKNWHYIDTQGSIYARSL